MSEYDASQQHPAPPGVWMTPADALNRGFELPTPGGAAQALPNAPSVDTPLLKRSFRIGKLHLLITADVRCEYSQAMPTYPVPNTPPWFPGVANFRGNILPIFDLHQVLHQPREDRGQINALVIGEGEDAAGIIIDGLPAQRPYSEHQRVTQLPRLEEPLNLAVIGGYREDAELLIEIDYSALLSAILQHSN